MLWLIPVVWIALLLLFVTFLEFCARGRDRRAEERRLRLVKTPVRDRRDAA